jgi:hypothetical protein
MTNGTIRIRLIIAAVEVNPKDSEESIADSNVPIDPSSIAPTTAPATIVKIKPINLFTLAIDEK